jgi:hypothetical protein
MGAIVQFVLQMVFAKVEDLVYVETIQWPLPMDQVRKSSVAV